MNKSTGFFAFSGMIILLAGLQRFGNNSYKTFVGTICNPWTQISSWILIALGISLVFTPFIIKRNVSPNQSGAFLTVVFFALVSLDLLFVQIM